MKVLFLDDEPYIVKMAESMLLSLGYEVVSTGSSDGVISLFRDSIRNGSAFDAVILDLTIKGDISGIRILNILRSEFPDIRAIASSGYSEDPVLIKPGDFGFRQAIKKPYTRDELRNALESVSRSDD